MVGAREFVVPRGDTVPSFAGGRQPFDDVAACVDSPVDRRPAATLAAPPCAVSDLARVFRDDRLDPTRPHQLPVLSPS